jgi:FAD/FMN-containing dehydrogenase
VSHTGVGGLTLGGGMGWLARQAGLACDNVEAYEVVTASGAVVRATATENPDLFWGLRGGGGNFGIVTEFEFRLHPVGTRALVVELYFGLDEAVAVIGAWRDLNADAPRQATFTAAVGVVGTAYVPAELHETPMITLGYVWVGDPEEGKSLLPSFRALGTPLGERAEEMSYVELQRQDDSDMKHTLRRYWKGHYFSELSDAAIDAFWRRGSADGHGEHLPAVGLQAYGGAIAEVPDEDAAFSHRDAQFELVVAARWEDPADDPIWTNAVRAAAASLDSFASGAYVNTLGDEGAVGVGRAYPPAKFARLVALKDTYDPDNVFHLNQNIPPSGRSGG